MPNGQAIVLAGPTTQCLVGGNALAGQGNLISGNSSSGITIYGASHGNSVCGNVIGLNAGQNAALPNNGNGVSLYNFVTRNVIGLPQPGWGNVISGNTGHGIHFDQASESIVQNNIIGLSSSGLSFGNNFGICLATSSPSQLIGGVRNDGRFERNVISANAMAISVRSDNNSICGNYIGTNSSGTVGISNTLYTLYLHAESENNLIGGANIDGGDWYGNIIVGDTFSGITNDGSSGNTITGNWIGVLADHSVPLLTFTNGIYLSNNSRDNVIGSFGDGQGNLIANSAIGVNLIGSGTDFNRIWGNTISAFSVAGIVLGAGCNEDKPAPLVGMADMGLVSGTAQAFDYIEVFKAEARPGARGGSLIFVNSTFADAGGYWELYPAGLLANGDYACAIATDGSNNTSAFSYNVLVTALIPTYTPTFTATITPTYSPTATITPTLTITVTSTISPTSTVTPTMTLTPTVTPTTALGDVDLGGKQVLAYPNPAQDQMTFVFHLDQAAEVKVLIYNLAGERVAELSGDFTAGRGQTLVWECGDVAPGVYLAVVLHDNKKKDTLKIAITK